MVPHKINQRKIAVPARRIEGNELPDHFHGALFQCLEGVRVHQSTISYSARSRRSLPRDGLKTILRCVAFQARRFAQDFFMSPNSGTPLAKCGLHRPEAHYAEQ
jgi:hypothetical protein